MAATPPPRPKQLDHPSLPTMFRIMGRAQVWIFKRTGGRIGNKWRIGAGFRKPVATLLLEHRGAKSGADYTSPLLYMPDGDDIVIVASQGGLTKNPHWYHNLRANPETHIRIGREHRPVRADLATPAERARLWPLLVETYADFDTYQSWTTREIPVFVLRPR
ncbi:nitroreductase family deazaflavin-dependent oxidoreductase [Nocardia sp. NPDC005978]|uniref:nitroreductase family deazaflavin-dependent oxidoreductase n=1 Tax=unclassified Nocardia TaxID=2637762 RepID=UPI0033A24C53